VLRIVRVDLQQHILIYIYSKSQTVHLEDMYVDNWSELLQSSVYPFGLMSSKSGISFHFMKWDLVESRLAEINLYLLHKLIKQQFFFQKF
jgi:hypothetical protein